jgi:site-specific DNA-methyltransferase (adenine-specific)
MKPYYEDTASGITIYHGDCREVLPTIRSVAVTVTDPPYNVGLDYSDGDRRADYAEWTREWFSLAPRPLVVTPGTVNLHLWLTMEKPRWTCAWFKPNQSSPSALNGWNVWEPVLVYGKHAKPVGHDAWLDYIGTNQRSHRDAEAMAHPAPKWLPFWTRLILAFSEPGDIVLDPFMGSGTGARACANIGRQFIGIEIEERYCEIAAKRLAQGVLFSEGVA